MSRFSKVTLVFVIIILTCLVYSNSLENEFVLDDSHLIEGNVYLKSWVHLPKIFLENNISASFGRKTNIYRPFQIFTYLLEYSLWKSNVVGYHAINILLHILVALLVFWLIVILYGNIILAFIASLLFALHPVHTEVVTYISGRADSLSLIFMLFSFILYIKESNKNSAKLYIFMLASYAFALLSREGSLIFPLIILFYHYVFKKKVKAKDFLAILSVSCAYVLLRVYIFTYTLSNVSVTTNIFQRVAAFFAAMAEYLLILIMPFGLHMEYGIKIFQFSDPRVILGAVILILAALYLVIKRNNNIILFSLGWFFILLLPVSGIVPLNAYMAEHWLYGPSIGFFLFLAYGFSILYSKRKYRIFAVVFVAILLSAYSYLTFRQNTYWKDRMTFFTRTLKFSPDNQRVLINLGFAYSNSGDQEAAIVFYKKAIDMAEESKEVPYAYYGLGIAYQILEKYEDAFAAYSEVIRNNPNFAFGYNSIGRLYVLSGNIEDGIKLYKKAIEISPLFPEAHFNLGDAYVKLGDSGEAIKAYHEALRINPGYSDAYANLALAYARIGKESEAEKFWNKAVRLNPKDATAHSNLARFYFYHKQYSLAAEHCKRAMELGYKFEYEFLQLLSEHLENDLKG